MKEAIKLVIVSLVVSAGVIIPNLMANLIR